MQHNIILLLQCSCNNFVTLKHLVWIRMDANVLRSYCDVRTTRYPTVVLTVFGMLGTAVVCTTVSVGVSFIYESLWNFDWKFDEISEILTDILMNVFETGLMTLTSWLSRFDPNGSYWIRIETIRCWEQICFVNFIVKRLNCTEYEILQRSIVLDSTRYKNQQNMHPRATKMKKLLARKPRFFGQFWAAGIKFVF